MFCLFSVPSRNSTSLYRSLSFLFPVSEVASEEVEEVKGVEEKMVDVGGGSGERMKGRKRKTEKGEGVGKRKKIKGTENEEEEEEEEEVECEENEGQTSEDEKSRKELDKLLGRGNGLCF